MLVAQALRSFHGLDNGKATSGPKFRRKQAEDWLFYEDQIIQRVNSLMHQLNGPAGYQLTRRPYRINWFINQLAMCACLFSLSLRLGGTDSWMVDAWFFGITIQPFTTPSNLLGPFLSPSTCLTRSGRVLVRFRIVLSQM